MKYFKNFFSFRELITEQAKQKEPIKKVGPSKEVIGTDKFEVKAKPKTKKSKLKLDYTQKYDQPEYKEEGKEGWFWNGSGGQRDGLPDSNYRNEWVNKIVKNAFSSDEKKQKMVEGLKKYVSDKRPDWQTVDGIIKKEVKKTGDESKLWYVIKFLATDGKVGPFHRIVANVISEEIKPIEPETLPDDEPQAEPEKGVVEEEPTYTTTQRSTTRDPSTGRLGELEKIEKQYKVKGNSNLEKILSLDYPSGELDKFAGEEQLKNNLSRLGRVENISDKVVGDQREITFNCVKNRNDFLKKDLYVYVFYKRDDPKSDLGINRRLMKQNVETFKFVLPEGSESFLCNVIFTTELFGIGDDRFSKNPSLSLKISSNNNKITNLLNLLTTQLNKPFSSTDHKGPVYSTQKIER